MPLALDTLRDLLVDRWCVLSSDKWNALKARYPASSDLLQYLQSTARFRRFQGSLRYVTAELRQAILSSPPGDPIIMIGTNRWLKLEHLPTGGQAAVWIACPCDATATADQLVALKVPTPARPGALRHLQHEIDVLRRINSPHIAGLVNYDRPTGTLATRLVDGPSLEKVVHEHQRLSVYASVRIAIHVCRALESLHAIGEIHKDVKPGNIVIDRSNGDRAILVDFGLAEDPAAGLPRYGGTPYYMAPEVFDPESPIDRRADVYSLAATLFRLLTGRPPHFQQCLAPIFQSPKSKLDELRFKLADSALDCNAEDIRRDVPHQVSELVCRSLSPNRDDRPATATEFGNELERIRARLKQTIQIERELWSLSDILLEAFRVVFKDADYHGKERANAEHIQRELERALTQISALSSLKAGDWSDIGSVCAVIPSTVRILTQLKALSLELQTFLSTAVAPSRHAEQTELLKDLVVRTQESVRSLSRDALKAAHDWRTALVQLGLQDSR